MSRGGALALAVSIGIAGGAAAQDSALEPIPAACAPMVGTFLTVKLRDGVPAPDTAGRSLLAFTNGGHAFLSDSAQGGIPGFAAFSAARGAWRCKVSNGTIRYRATMVDFTYASDAHPDQQVVRVEIEGASDSAGIVEGTTEVSFYPLAADPFADAADSSLRYDFTAERIEVGEWR